MKYFCIQEMQRRLQAIISLLWQPWHIHIWQPFVGAPHQVHQPASSFWPQQTFLPEGSHLTHLHLHEPVDMIKDFCYQAILEKTSCILFHFAFAILYPLEIGHISPTVFRGAWLCFCPNIFMKIPTYLLTSPRLC